MTTHATARRLVAVVTLATLGLGAIGCLPPTTRSATGQPAGPGEGAVPTDRATPGAPTPRPSIVRPTPTPAPTFAVYTVQPGDNLNLIARRFGTTARSIAYWNRATFPSLDPDSSAYRPNALTIGWNLNIIPNVILTDDETPPLPSPSA